MPIDPICQMPVDDSSPFVTECDGRTYYFCSEGCRDRFVAETSCGKRTDRYDLIVVGGGPAGLTAATFAATLKIRTFMISKDLGGQAVDSTRIENYMGFDFITGPELIERFRHQLIVSHYVDHLLAGVEKVEPETDGFRVSADNGDLYRCRSLILATGMNRRKLGAPGEETFQRRGIFYGQVPDYSFVEDEDVAVVGGGNSALQIVETLQTVARHVHLVCRGTLNADAAIVDRVLGKGKLTCHEGFDTVAFTGEKTLRGIDIRDRESRETKNLAVRGAFIAIGLRPNSSLAADLVDLNHRGEILVGPDGSTACRGLFAAGDVTEVFAKRIIVASGEGAKAAIAARQYLLHLDRQTSSREARGA